MVGFDIGNCILFSIKGESSFGNSHFRDSVLQSALWTRAVFVYPSSYDEARLCRSLGGSMSLRTIRSFRDSEPPQVR